MSITISSREYLLELSVGVLELGQGDLVHVEAVAQVHGGLHRRDGAGGQAAVLQQGVDERVQHLENEI